MGHWHARSTRATCAHQSNRTNLIPRVESHESNHTNQIPRIESHMDARIESHIDARIEGQWLAGGMSHVPKGSIDLMPLTFYTPALSWVCPEARLGVSRSAGMRCLPRSTWQRSRLRPRLTSRVMGLTGQVHRGGWHGAGADVYHARHQSGAALQRERAGGESLDPHNPRSSMVSCVR